MSITNSKSRKVSDCSGQNTRKPSEAFLPMSDDESVESEEDKMEAENLVGCSYYPDLVVKDFEAHRNYEESILKVMNVFSKYPTIDPTNKG